MATSQSTVGTQTDSCDENIPNKSSESAGSHPNAQRTPTSSSDEENVASVPMDRGNLLRSSKIVTKMASNEMLPLIKNNAATYALLQQRSKHIVDKSLLLKELLLSEQQFLRICLPRRMGKTMVLTMIQAFFAPSKLLASASEEEKEQEKTDRKQLFTDTSIMEDTDFVKEYFMEIPVLYVSLKGVVGGTLEEVLENFRQMLQEICQEYKFIYDKYTNQPDKRNFLQRALSSLNPDSDYLFGFMGNALGGGAKLKEKDLTGAFQILISILFAHYGKKQVIVLIDEYDQPVSSEFDQTKAERKKIEQFHQQLIRKALKDNKCVRLAVLAGIFRKEIPGLALDNDFNLLTQHFMLAYFGFSEATMDEFQRNLGVKKEHMELTKKWYNGYMYKFNGVECKLYNSYSITRFLNEYVNVRKRVAKNADIDINAILKLYWTEEDNLQRFSQLFKMKQIRPEIEKMLADKGKHKRNPRMLGVRMFGQKEWEALAKVSECAESVDIQPDFANIFFSYLCHTGYLSFSDSTLFIPNLEIKHFLGQQLIDYYQQRFAFDIRLADEVTTTLAKAARKVPSVADGVKSPRGLETAIEDFRKSFEEFLESVTEVNNESFSQALLTFMCNRIYDSRERMHEETFTLPFAEELRLDIAFHIAGTGVTTIIEMKFGPKRDRSAEIGLWEANYYRRCFKKLDKDGRQKYSHIKHFLLLGVNVAEKDGKKKVTVESEVKKPEDADVETPEKVQKNASHKKAKELAQQQQAIQNDE